MHHPSGHPSACGDHLHAHSHPPLVDSSLSVPDSQTWETPHETSPDSAPPSGSCTHHHSAPTTPAKQQQLLVACGLIGTFAIAEWGIGHFSHSLALVADSGHLVSDCLALVLALAATILSQRPTLQDKQLEVWAALFNGVSLGGIAGLIAWEAIQHWIAGPEAIATLPMLVTACVGIVVNGINVTLLHQGSHEDLNLRAAWLHMLADMLSAIGVVFAAVAIAVFGWLWIDSAIGLVIAGLIFSTALPLLLQSLQALRIPPVAGP